MAGLLEGERSGRPRRLNEKQLQEINSVLRQMPREVGLGGNLWDGKTLAAWIEREYGITWGCGNASDYSGNWVSAAQAAPGDSASRSRTTEDA